MTYNEWPDCDVAVLRKLWREGHTGTQISKALGGRYSRNAVQGKADRLGLANRSHKGGRAVPLKVRTEVTAKPRGRTRQNANPRGNPSTAALAPLPAPKPIQQPSLSVPFPLLERRQCQFATSAHEAREHRFCGHPVEPSRPFCPAHCAIAYAAPKT